jgi:hypothetical protein
VVDEVAVVALVVVDAPGVLGDPWPITRDRDPANQPAKGARAISASRAVRSNAAAYVLGVTSRFQPDLIEYPRGVVRRCVDDLERGTS